MNGTMSIREIAKELGTGFQRSGQRSGFIEFVEAEEKAAQSKIDAIVAESNRVMREVEEKKRSIAVQEERRRLRTEPTDAVYSVIPRVSMDQVGNATTEDINRDIAAAVATFRSRIEISKPDWTLLVGFMEQNELDCRDVGVWEKALQFIIDRLTDIENGGPVPEKVAPAPVVEEDRNPFAPSSHPQSAYMQWEKQHLDAQIYAEVMPLVRATVEDIVKDGGKDFEISSLHHLIDTVRKKSLIINRENVRAEWLRIWGKEMHESSRQAVFTEQELSDWRNEIEDRHLSADQLRAKYVYGPKL